MNIKEAKAIPLLELLARLGHKPTHTRGSAIWYRSPLRGENTPSFKVDAIKNVWFDFGLGRGGTNIDLVQALYGEDTRRTLGRIADLVNGLVAPLELMPTVPIPREVSVPEIIGNREIADQRLMQYLLRERHIPIDLARVYLRELEYRVGERTYTALGFQNRSGGFELRNSIWKGCIGRKDITTFEQPERKDLVAFEGVFDYLSALAYHASTTPSANVLVLNSVAMVERAGEYIASREIDQITTYFDHDEAGARARARLLELHANARVHDGSDLYLGHNDFNDFWKTLSRQR